jgi:hypothetical protein
VNELVTLTLDGGEITGHLRQGIEERIRSAEENLGGETRITRVIIYYERKGLERTHEDLGPRLPRSHDRRDNPLR